MGCRNFSELNWQDSAILNPLAAHGAHVRCSGAFKFIRALGVEHVPAAEGPGRISRQRLEADRTCLPLRPSRCFRCGFHGSSRSLAHRDTVLLVVSLLPVLRLTSRAAVEDEFAFRARPQDDAIVALGCAAVGALARVAGSAACNFA